MPRPLSFFILDSFTDTPFAGNPAGVVFHDGSLTDGEMQRVAGELHLETAFLTPALSEDGDYTVAYYTGVRRIPLCGHDTIAAVTALVHTKRLAPPARVRFLTDVGPLALEVSETGQVTMGQTLPAYGAVVPAAPIADALGIPISVISETGLAPQIVSTGTPFLLVPITHRHLLNALRPEMPNLGPFLQDLPDSVAGLYAWTWETLRDEAAVHARCFCPTAGLPEDPVTGTAGGALGAYIARHGLLPVGADGLTFETEQGFAMGRPGSVTVKIGMRAGEVIEVQVRGRAILIAQGTLWA